MWLSSQTYQQCAIIGPPRTAFLNFAWSSSYFSVRISLVVHDCKNCEANVAIDKAVRQASQTCGQRSNRMRQASEHCRLGGDSVPLPEPEKPLADGRPAKATEPAPFLGQRDQRRQRKSRKEKNQFPDEAQTQKGNTENKKPTRHGNWGKDSSRLGGQITESSRRRLARSLPFFCVLQYFFLQPIPVAATSCDATENDISF